MMNVREALDEGKLMLNRAALLLGLSLGPVALLVLLYSYAMF